MIETRPLERLELNVLLAEAPHDETKNLLHFLAHQNMFAYDFLNKNAVYKFGLIIDKKPIYMAHVVRSNDKYELWTVVNKDVREQKTLYKYSKKALQEALKQFSPIYATMEKHLHKNLAWTKKMGFKVIHEDDKVVSLRIGE